MILDKLNLLHGTLDAAGTISGVAGFASGTNIPSANCIDVGVNLRDLGEGQPLFGRFTITAAFTGGTSMEMQIVAADGTDLTTGTVTVLGTTGAIPVASLTPSSGTPPTGGSRFVCAINPRLASKGQRYIGARFVNVGANAAGSLIADIGTEIQDGLKFYPNGFAVL